jgi:ABC-type transport system involved in multi-copper enzyme maturation permease subunit
MIKIGNTHLKQSIKGIWKKTLVLCAALFIFLMLFALMGTSVKIQDSIIKDMDDVPPVVQKMFGEGFLEAMLKYGIIAVGYIHPFLLALFIVFIFIAVSQMVTSEVAGGTIGFTLSKAVSRKRLYLNLAVVIIGGLGILALFTFLSSLVGIALFHGPKLSAGPFVSLTWNLFLVMFFIAGYIVIFAAVSDSGKALFTWGGVVLLVLYLLSLAAPLWKPLTYLKPINPFAYFEAMKVLMGGRIGFSTSISIIVVSLAMFAFAAWLFSRRDISSG